MGLPSRPRRGVRSPESRKTGCWLPSRVWIADRQEHTPEDALVELHTRLPQELSEGTLGVEEVVSLRHETLGFVLSVRTLAGLSGQHQLRKCFSGERERPRCSKTSRNTALSSLSFGSTTKCATRSSSYQGRRAHNVHFRHFLSELFRQQVGTRFTAEGNGRRLSGGSLNIASSF